MAVVIQKHRSHPIYKFYDEARKYLGIILGTSSDTVDALTLDIAKVLKGQTVSGLTKETKDDNSIDIIKAEKRVGGFEKDFSAIGDAIEQKLG